MPKKSPAVTIIIPVYNCEGFLRRCLDSVYAQTFTDYEIIAVNDGSTDSSLEILQRNAGGRKNSTVIDQANHGQGYSRNHALKQANGEYVLFLDSDDYIESNTLQAAKKLADETCADFVQFDWKMSFGTPGGEQRVEYFNSEAFSDKQELAGDACDELLQLNNFYSVNNLYRRSFLIDNHVTYDEGHIYEDTLFMVHAANAARKISLLHEPLYVVQMNTGSTTQSGRNAKHPTDFLRSVQKAFEILQPRMQYSTYYLAGYFIEKFIIYYQKRVPHRLRRRYLRKFVDAMSAVPIAIPEASQPKKLLNACIRRQVFARHRYWLFHLFVLYKTKLLPAKDIVTHKPH